VTNEKRTSTVKPVTVVAMSGGVDSSVAAAVLKEQGRDVIGIGLQLVDPEDVCVTPGSCCGIESMEDARRVAEKLGFPFYVLNFKDVFRTFVTDYFIDSYLRGETPNPCVPCNDVIKFAELLRSARGLGATCLATGHYARIEPGSGGRLALKKGIDGNKDQSYFLYSLTQEQLAAASFPLGEMTKTQTRSVALELGLKVHDKPESQDICFVGVEGYAAFIEQRCGHALEPGPILDDSGAVVGEHKGLVNYTIGQRRGLGISFPEPMYVVDVDPGSNSITITTARGLNRQKQLVLDRVNYVSIVPPSTPVRVSAMTRYRKAEVPATMSPLEGGAASLEFDDPQEPTAPGQSVVLYDGDTVLAGGIAVRGFRG